jgi:hypothetical protein
MVAYSGCDAIGVLIGAKRLSGTLVHKIAVHPDQRRQGHGRHVLASRGSKLAILGPPRMIEMRVAPVQIHVMSHSDGVTAGRPKGLADADALQAA